VARLSTQTRNGARDVSLLNHAEGDNLARGSGRIAGRERTTFRARRGSRGLRRSVSPPGSRDAWYRHMGRRRLDGLSTINSVAKNDLVTHISSRISRESWCPGRTRGFCRSLTTTPSVSTISSGTSPRRRGTIREIIL